MLYNAMIHPLIPYGIRGAIWYQGESNAPDPPRYQRLFPAMISDWRTRWTLGDFPFYYVQIAPYRYGSESDAAGLREAQRKTLAVKGTGMAVTTDIGDVRDIHPKQKQEVARRLALWAFAKTYKKKNITFSGPLYRSMKVQKGAIRIYFDHVDGGLVVRGDTLKEFMIAGEDRVFHDAQAATDGQSIVVSSPLVREPVAVRFGYSNTSEPNLFNGKGLPASPFRTDAW
jgi:sialate O-acetylesterase